jgi:CHAT domain-containing protein
MTDKLADNRERGPNPGDELVAAPFWVKTHCISYLPSLSVLRSLRTLAKERASGQAPLLAFADPIFRRPTAGAPEIDAAATRARSVLLRNLQAGSAVTAIELAPLPDTREEALQVAELLGASVENDVYLQARATEYNLKHARLNRYRHLLFATHGLLAGEFGPGTQPALAFSFVNDPENDGLLEMGEIFGLDLNADLAVLSACNTASGGGEEDRGEGFAGLTRSFMYAGARSLLVTQWGVETSSARRLVQATFSGIKQGRAKTTALALAKRELIGSDRLLQFAPDLRVSEAHPFFWAPYILVGEVR